MAESSRSSVASSQFAPFQRFLGVQMHDRKKLRMTRVVYNALRHRLMQADKGKAHEDSTPSDGVGRRPDLTAGSKMLEKDLYINTERRIGNVPGVNVGDIFFYRMEMCVVGLHKPTMGGIDYSVMEGYGLDKVAISIISSGGYEDDEDEGDKLTYTGQGGQASNKSQEIKQADNQKLERGNLALSNNIRFKVPVRVIRGIDNPGLYSDKIYVYDGLYFVEKKWFEVGKSGFGVYKFLLKRLPDQPVVASSVIKQCSEWVLDYNRNSKIGNKIIDVAQNKEEQKHIGTPFSNEMLKRLSQYFDYADKFIDVAQKEEEKHVYLWCNDEMVKRLLQVFDYAKSVSYTTSFKDFKPVKGCNCNGKCAKENCYCIARNGGQFPYTHNGCLVKNKNAIYECGSDCNCPPDCQNRLTQRGLKWFLEVFEAGNKGLGVWSWEPIPAGSFVCEYSGVATLSDQEVEDGEFVLHSSHKLSGNGIDFGAHEILSEGTKAAVGDSVRTCITIDSSKKGNVARFINHSCVPNLFQQFVLYKFNDTFVPHCMLFALESIPPMTELTLDYNERVSYQGRRKGKKCLCGEEDCRGQFF